MPLAVPCANQPLCPNYVTLPDRLCPDCRPRPVCPRCGEHMTDVIIAGTAYRVKKRTQIKRPYQWVSDDEVLYFRPIPLLIVQEKERNHETPTPSTRI